MASAVSKRAENSMSPRAPGVGSCIQLAILILLAAGVSACARRQPAVPAPVVPPPTRDVEALIERGCFSCLELALARADERRQTPLAFEAAVLLALRATETAETEFQEALKMDFGQCEAAFYLGGVRAELRKVPEAIAAMNQARQCYDLAISVRRRLFEDAMAKAVCTSYLLLTITSRSAIASPSATRIRPS
jgi:hypothetical protein